MKKLLTLILPALALTTGAPLAQDEGYLWGAIVFSNSPDEGHGTGGCHWSNKQGSG